MISAATQARSGASIESIRSIELYVTPAQVHAMQARSWLDETQREYACASASAGAGGFGRLLCLFAFYAE